MWMSCGGDGGYSLWLPGRPEHVAPSVKLLRRGGGAPIHRLPL